MLNQSKIVKYESHFREKIIAVWEKSVRATHHFLKTDDIPHLKKLVEQIDFHSFDVYCLLQNDRLIGFIGFEGKDIAMLFLDPEFIGQGYGRKLMDFALQEIHADSVDVNEQNEHAVKFYSRFGFVGYERLEKSPEGKDYPILKMKLKT